MILALILFLGLCFGSLATLLSYRLPLGEPVGWTRSRCPPCGKELAPRDLVPLFTWLFRKGTCACGKTRVHWRYPATELLTAALFAHAYLVHGLDLALLALFALALGLVVMTVTDFEHGIIPDPMQWWMLAAALAYHGLMGSYLPRVLTGGAMGLGVGLLLRYGFYAIRRRHGLGLGDVKFLGVAGCWIGGFALAPFFVMSGIAGIALGLFWRMRFGKGAYPFGPALAFALWLIVLHPAITAWFWEWMIAVSA